MKRTYEQGYINGFAQSKKKIEELENNWELLKKFLLKKLEILWGIDYACYSDILDKMQEIEEIDKINNLKEND